MEQNLKKEEPFMQCIPRSPHPRRKQVQHESHNSSPSSSKVKKPCSSAPRPCTSTAAWFLLRESDSSAYLQTEKANKWDIFCHVTLQIFTAVFTKAIVLQDFKQYISSYICCCFSETWCLSINLQAPCFLSIGQVFRYSLQNDFYIFNQQIYFII